MTNGNRPLVNRAKTISPKLFLKDIRVVVDRADTDGKCVKKEKNKW